MASSGGGAARAVGLRHGTLHNLPLTCEIHATPHANQKHADDDGEHSAWGAATMSEAEQEHSAWGAARMSEEVEKHQQNLKKAQESLKKQNPQPENPNTGMLYSDFLKKTPSLMTPAAKPVTSAGAADSCKHEYTA